MDKHSIITVGFCPAWDIACRAEGLNWGDHKQLTGQTVSPAGKALNVSKALAWMGIRSTAAGLWGRDDYPMLQRQLTDPLIDVRMTLTDGVTRQNITVIDSTNNREMHLRAPCTLATAQSLEALSKDLASLISERSVVVFSGALPDMKYYGQALSIFEMVIRKRAKIAIDTSSPMYASIVESVPVFLIKPNLDELRQLVGRHIEDCPADIVAAARPLCRHVEYVAVSRGENGAMLISSDDVFSCRTSALKPPVQTVGCGDFLVAGLVANMENDPVRALTTGIKASTALAAGLFPACQWSEAENSIFITIEHLIT